MKVATAATAQLDAEERKFAERQRVGHLATADAAGIPKRLRNIAANAQVALIIDQYDEDWSRLAFLLVQGQAAPVSDAREYTLVLEALCRRYPQYRGMRLQFELHPMVRIAPRWRHLWRAAPRGRNAR
jgi:nitroimidazol reductase NimA-like FMN-containing flavoprotein (pyridoxamine 5'-phosphate oxidase superfamily)